LPQRDSLQIYSLHEAHGSYTPPAFIEELSAVHKDQRFSMDHHGGPAGGEHQHDGRTGIGSATRREAHADQAHHAHFATALLKAFFALVAIGLVFSTLAGIWMALQQRLRRRTHLVLLLVGTIVPLILGALTA
jgi:hypothetical protein